MTDTAVALGRFDGLHQGHRAVLAALVGLRAKGLLPVVARVESDGPSLYTYEESAELFASLGVEALASLSPATVADPRFAERILAGRLGARALACGPLGLLGRERLSGEGRRLGLAIESVDAVRSPDGKAVSSARVRAALADGDAALAAELLGRPFSIRGTVVHGKALGRTVGMPTANLEVAPEKTLPRYGVYVVSADIDGRVALGVTHIGPRPSVDDEARVTIETHFLDFSGELYGKTIELRLVSYLREIVKLDGIEAVRRQVAIDVRRARSLS